MSNTKFPVEFLLVTGGPMEGFVHFGPFHDYDTAQAWGEKHHAENVFWVVPLVSVAEWEAGAAEYADLASSEFATKPDLNDAGALPGE